MPDTRALTGHGVFARDAPACWHGDAYVLEGEQEEEKIDSGDQCAEESRSRVDIQIELERERENNANMDRRRAM